MLLHIEKSGAARLRTILRIDGEYGPWKDIIDVSPRRDITDNVESDVKHQSINFIFFETTMDKVHYFFT